MQKDNCKEPLHNHHDGCPSCESVIKELEYKISELKAELKEAEKFNKMQS